MVRKKKKEKRKKKKTNRIYPFLPLVNTKFSGLLGSLEIINSVLPHNFQARNLNKKLEM